jgi:hypothetical protein
MNRVWDLRNHHRRKFAIFGPLFLEQQGSFGLIHARKSSHYPIQSNYSFPTSVTKKVDPNWRDLPQSRYLGGRWRMTICETEIVACQSSTSMMRTSKSDYPEMLI